MNVSVLTSQSPKTELVPAWFSRELFFRALLAAGAVTFAHQLRWEWLRFMTSEVILRLSPLFDMTTARITFDTIRVRHASFNFVVSCTFVDVFAGAIPLLWNVCKSVLGNYCKLVAAAASLFGLNIVRLEIAQILYAQGLPWPIADEVLGGVAYFLVWLMICRVLAKRAALTLSRVRDPVATSAR